MIPVKTISLGVAGIALAGWVGITSMSGGVAQKGDFSLLAEISRDFSPASSSYVAAKVDEDRYMASAVITLPVQTTIKKQTVAIAPVAQEIPSSTPTTTVGLSDEIKKCTYETKLFPNYNKLIINEVAWMGTKADSSTEWIELKNVSEEQIELEGYQLFDKAEQIKITLPKATLAPGAFYILERGEEDEHVLTADLMYTGALSNSNEGLRLFDRYCFLVDQVEATPKWPAGEATSKKSMERGGGMYWYTYSGSAVDSIWGTPGKTNSAPTAPPAQLAGVSQSVQEMQESSATITTAAAENLSTVVTEVVPEVVYALKVVISRVQITGGPGKTTEDFVQLYNPGPGQFNLKGYRLVKRTKTGASDTSLKSWTADALIAEGGVYAWANTNYPGSADMRTSGSIADDNAVALRKGSEDTGEIIDAVGWGAAANALVEGAPVSVNPIVGQVLVRKNNQDTNNNSADFEVQ